MNQPAPDADVLLNSAVRFYEAGDFEAAEAHCRRALAIAAAHAGALELLGVVQLEQSRYAEAEPIFEQLVQGRPGEPSHWMNLGTARRGSGRHEQALAAYARAASLGESSANFCYHVGLTHMQRSDLESARALFARGLELAPDDADMRLHYAQVCYEATYHEEALAALAAWPTAAATPVDVAAGVGNLLMNLGQPQRAEALLRRAIAEHPTRLPDTLALVQLLERTNRVAEAAALLQSLAANPKSHALGAELLMTRARVEQRLSHHELAIEYLIQAMPDFKRSHERHRMLFPMAQSLDALGRYDDAYAALVKAHASQLAQVGRTAPLAAMRGTPQMKVTELDCDAADVALWDHARAPGTADSPVFVVAFPRSGTTLLELTLDAHPLLRAMDEQPFIQNALEDMVALGAKYPRELARLTAAQLDEVRAQYWQRVAKKVQLGPGQRLVDKNPLNILRLPVIRRLFPDAPVILAIRHPCDVIMSCYMQHFSAPDWAMLCADLPGLASGYRKTFEYWYRSVTLLQPRVMEVRYEQLVSDFPTVVRAMVDFLQLPWDPALLAPADEGRVQRFISTPSYAQVAQPVHGRAVGRWEHYRRYLEPVLAELQPCLARWNYSA
jgi:tetratricopeptide (TPR) repeat protein